MGTQDDHIKRLNAFLKQVGGRHFSWGDWDCLIFTNEAFRAMHGVGWADDLLRRYMHGGKLLTREQIRREYGYQAVDEMLRDRLTQAHNVPPRGALVIGGPETVEAGYLGVGFGISVGSSAAFLSASGVVYCPIETIDSAWVRNDAA